MYYLGMYDIDMTAEHWKSYRRALKHLFKLLYGEWPTLKTVHRVNDELFPYAVTIASPEASCTIQSHTKLGCLNYLLDTMKGKIEDARRDWDEDDWLTVNREREARERAEERAEDE